VDILAIDQHKILIIMDLLILLTSAKNIINYLKYRALARYFNYLKWRIVYTLIEQNLHITEDGINQILDIKNSMNSKAID
jgi:hypothetical protein